MEKESEIKMNNKLTHEFKLIFAKGDDYIHWCQHCGTIKHERTLKGEVFYIPGKGSIPNSQECKRE